MENKMQCIDSVEKCGILGVGLVLAQVANTSVVIHGPKGCVYPAYEASINYPLNINYTEMCEKSTVFGGEQDVSEKIVDEYYENVPDLMAVVTTCASEIIGEDLDGLIALAHLPIPVIRIDGGGFLNTQTSGMNMAMKTLIEQLCEEGDSTAPTVNLISPICIGSNWQEDILYLSDLLIEFGIHARPLFCQTTVDDIKEYAHACLNVIVCEPIGLEAAVDMDKRFGIPYLCLPYPLGIEKIECFIKSICSFLHNQHGLSDALNEKRALVKKKFHSGIGKVDSFRFFEYIRQLNKMIVAPPAMALSVLNIVTNEFEDQIETLIIKSTADKNDMDLTEKCTAISPSTTVIVADDNQEIRRHIQKLNPQVLLGSDMEYYFAKEFYEPAYINICYPGVRELHFHRRPVVGYEGLLHFFEKWYNKIISRYF